MTAHAQGWFVSRWEKRWRAYTLRVSLGPDGLFHWEVQIRSEVICRRSEDSLVVAQDRAQEEAYHDEVERSAAEAYRRRHPEGQPDG